MDRHRRHAQQRPALRARHRTRARTAFRGGRRTCLFRSQDSASFVRAAGQTPQYSREAAQHHGATGQGDTDFQRASHRPHQGCCGQGQHNGHKDKKRPHAAGLRFPAQGIRDFREPPHGNRHDGHFRSRCERDCRQRRPAGGNSGRPQGVRHRYRRPRHGDNRRRRRPRMAQPRLRDRRTRRPLRYSGAHGELWRQRLQYFRSGAELRQGKGSESTVATSVFKSRRCLTFTQTPSKGT